MSEVHDDLDIYDVKELFHTAEVIDRTASASAASYKTASASASAASDTTAVPKSTYEKESVLYILKLTNDKWYVGITKNWQRRQQEHNNGNMEWTAKYKPIDYKNEYPKLIRNPGKFDELTTTLDYMLMYGIDNVRGSAFCKVFLSYSEKTVIKSMLCAIEDRCYKCNSLTHKASGCAPEKKRGEKRKHIQVDTFLESEPEPDIKHVRK